MRQMLPSILFLLAAVGSALFSAFALKSEAKATRPWMKPAGWLVTAACTLGALAYYSETGVGFDAVITCTANPGGDYCIKNPNLNLLSRINDKLIANNKARREDAHPKEKTSEWQNFIASMPRRDFRKTVKLTPDTWRDVAVEVAPPKFPFGTDRSRWLPGNPKAPETVKRNELSFWEWSESKYFSCEPLREYMILFPNGDHYEEAKSRLYQIKNGQSRPVVSAYDRHGPYLAIVRNQPTTQIPARACVNAAQKLEEKINKKCNFDRKRPGIVPSYEQPFTTIYSLSSNSCLCRDMGLDSSHYECAIEVFYDCNYTQRQRVDWESCPSVP